MTAIPLQIKYCQKAVRDPAAWFIPGHRTGVFLDELVQWNVALHELALFVMPTSGDDPTPLGIFVIPSPHMQPRPTQRAHAFGRVADRLFVPVEAEFDPPITDNELAKLLSANLDCLVWHPTVGLVGFESDDCLRVSDLLEELQQRPTNWNLADPGITFATRLLSIQAVSIPDVQSVIEQSRDDIGTQAEELDQLPEAPDEPNTNPVSQAGRSIQRGFARAVDWISSRTPSGADAPTWINRAQDWARNVLERTSPHLFSQRAKELQRLLHLLKTNPDEGLRHALPLTCDARHRGAATPSARLGRHDVNFNLNQLFGGGAADAWEVPPDVLYQLLEHYRRLATREMQLGRHRRAAYIFAELLGDLESAASALVAGGHHREAAVLYKDRLHRPVEAARCLENAGLWHEAIELYEETQQFDRAAEIYQQLDQPDEAQECYRKAVRHHQDAGNYLKAADLQTEQLQEPDAALKTLDAGWKDSNQAGKCLQKSFELMGSLGRHDQAAGRVRELRQSTHSKRRTQLMLDAFKTAALSYPSHEVRSKAADSARVVVSKSLFQADMEETNRLLGTIRQLVPEDRLLERDCEKYRSNQADRQTYSLKRVSRGIRLVREIKLPSGVYWRAAARGNMSYFVAGFRGRELVVARGFWDDPTDQPSLVTWRLGATTRSLILLASDPTETTALNVYVPGNRPLRERTFPETDLYAPGLPVGTPSWLTSDVLALSRTLHGVTWIVAIQNDEFTLSAFDRNGVPLTTSVFSGELYLGEYFFVASSLITPLPFHVRSDKVYLGLDDNLMTFRGSELSMNMKMPYPVRDISGSMANTRVRIAVTYEQGGLIYWDHIGGSSQSIARDMRNPSTMFTRSGLLIAANDERFEVYRTKGGRAELVAERDAVGAAPLGMLTVRNPDQFAICGSDGVIRIFEVC